MKRINEMVTELSRCFLRLQCGCQNPVTYEPFQLSLPTPGFQHTGKNTKTKLWENPNIRISKRLKRIIHQIKKLNF